MHNSLNCIKRFVKLAMQLTGFHCISTPSLLGARRLVEVVECKPESLLVVSLSMALNEMLPPLCGRQVASLGEGWAPPGVLA